MKVSKPKTAKPSFWKKPWIKNLRNPVEYRERIADGVCETARRTLPNPSVYLMGSTYRGTAHHVSDLDLAIFHNLTGEEANAKEHQLYLQIKKISEETGVIIKAGIYGPEMRKDWEFPAYRQRISGPDLWDLRTIPIEDDREGTGNWHLRGEGKQSMFARLLFDRAQEQNALGILGKVEKMLSGLSIKSPSFKKFFENRQVRNSIKFALFELWTEKAYGANARFVLAQNPRIRAKMAFAKIPGEYYQYRREFKELLEDSPEVHGLVFEFSKQSYAFREFEDLTREKRKTN